MKLAELFQDVPNVRFCGDQNVSVRGVSMDSREVSNGDVFFALTGEKTDGHLYIQDAIQKGAKAVAVEQERPPLSVPLVLVPKPRDWIGPVAAKIYGYPSQKLTVVGITGTNGKTTTAHLIEAILKEAENTTGYIGTVGYRWKDKKLESLRTTPEAPELQQTLSQMLCDGVSHVVIECSSHGLEFDRLNGLDFDVAVLTNISQDHLDFHKNMQEYSQAKWKLFGNVLKESSKARRVAVLNVDDEFGLQWSSRIQDVVVTYSLDPSKKADVYPKKFSLSTEGIYAEVSLGTTEISIKSKLVGLHNLSNILCTLAVGWGLKIPKEVMAKSIQSQNLIPGRLEKISNPFGVHAFVDYAHTEDALENVLKALKPFHSRRLIVVFGCGGDRDRLKRPKMAQAVACHANVIFVTSDNPRTENPDSIIKDAVQGIPSRFHEQPAKELTAHSDFVYCTITDRRMAIERAIQIAAPDDIVLIAGKGHETYQEISGVRHSFDDRCVAISGFERRVL